MRCHFLISNVFIGQSRVVLRYKGQYSSTCISVLFFTVSDAFLSLNFTPERCLDPANNGQTGYINSNLQKILLLLSEFTVATDEIPGRIETTVLPQNLHFNHGRNPHCSRFMETGDINNEEAEALLSDEKIVIRKQSKADSVA